MSRPSLARTLYRSLTWVHPAARRGFGPDMMATFDALLASARTRGSVAVLALVTREIVGLVRAAWARESRWPQVERQTFGGTTVSQDVRHAFRLVVRQPAFSAAVVVTLGLGIGANTAIMSLANALLLQRLPFADPARLVMVWEDNSTAGFPRNTPSPADYDDWTRSIPALEGVAAIDRRDFNLTGVGDPENIGGAGATANLFDVLGVRPLLGRVWRADEDRSRQRVVVLSYALWQRRFHGDSSVVGRSATFNGLPYLVLGVMPSGFEFVSPDIEVWTPIAFDGATLQNRGSHYLWVVGRLGPGATLEQANVQLRTLASRLQRDAPGTNRNVGMYAVPLRDDYLGDTRMILALLFAGASLVLVVACANVANLLLARGAGRARETATRVALGASRSRLMQQLLIESVLLAGLGGALGLLLARLSFDTLSTLVPPALADLSHVGLDWRVLLATGVTSCVTAVLFGIVPALRGSRVDPATAGALRGSRGTIAGPTRFGRLLVVTEIAVATVVLIGAALIADSFRAASGLTLGFVPDRVLTMRLQLPRQPYADFDRRIAFVDDVLRGVRATAGVESAGFSGGVPFVWKGGTSGFVPEGQPIDRSLPYDAINRVVTPGYMETLRMTLQSGRFFDSRDTSGGQPVVIVNDRLAHQYFPGTDPIGRRLKSGAEGSSSQWRTVVGVVADTYALGLDRPTHAEAYFPLAQSRDNWMWPRNLAVRATGDPVAVIAMIRTAVHDIDPAQPVSRIAPLTDIVSTELQARRTQTMLMVAYGVIALLLAAVGIYGLLSYTVAARTAEIGVRLALGGDPARIRALVVGQGMAMAASGLVAGLVIAAWASRLVEPLLFHVAPHDPWAFASQSLLLAIVCFAAIYGPARRASRVDPLEALRSE